MSEAAVTETNAQDTTPSQQQLDPASQSSPPQGGVAPDVESQSAEITAETAADSGPSYEDDLKEVRGTEVKPPAEEKPKGKKEE